MARGGKDSDTALAALLLYVTNPHSPPWRGGRSLAATFPLLLRIELDHGLRELEIFREREGSYLASLNGSEHRFEIDELDADTIRYRSGGVTERIKYLRDGERLYFQHRGITHSVRDLTLAATSR